MKPYSNQVYALIKAMSPKEKFFFKVFGVKKQGSPEDFSYIILFDVLNSMKEYDDDVLKRKLKESGFNHNIEKAKKYLMKALLNSLEEYHSGSSLDAEIHSLILKAEILYKKNLKKVANQLLHKAEKLSLEYEKHEYLLMINSLKATLAVDMSNIEAMKEFAKTGTKKQQKYLGLYINTLDYRNLAIEIGSIYNQSPQMIQVNKAADKRLKELFANPLLKDSKSALTFSSKQYFYKLNYQRIVNKNKGEEWEEWDEVSYQMLKEWVEYLEEKENMRKNFPEVYIYALIHLMIASGFQEGIRKAETLFNKARSFFMSLPKKNMNHNVQHAFMEMLTAYMDTQLKALHPGKCVEAFMDMSALKISIIGYINMALAYFLLGEHSKALSCINTVVNEKSDYRMDAQAMARIFVLIIHYELRNVDLLPYVAQASERWLIKHNFPIKSFDKMLINFFKYKLPKMESDKEGQEELSRLLIHIKQAEKQDYSILQKEEFYLIPWLESKLQNRPLIDIARQEAVKNKQKQS